MSFINTIFLFATAAAAIPVILHLVRRIKAKTVPFSTLMFLKATPKELVRKRRLKDRLLMAARAAMLLLLALAFARPYLPQERLPFVAQREAESVVVLIDRSYSMRYESAFERALEAVRQRLDRLAPGDEAALVAFADDAELLTPLSRDATTLRGTLDRLEPGFSATDYLPALQRAADVLADARNPRRVVVLASDFQESGWERTPSDWKLPPGIALEPLPAGASHPTNAYFEDFRHASRRIEGRTAVRFDARIAALGAAEGEGRDARLIMDGREVDRLSLPARASAPLSFEQFAPRSGYFQGMLSLDDDALPEDGHRYFTQRVEAAPTVLVVDGPSPTGRPDGFYLRTAFDLGEASRFTFARADAATPGLLRQASVAFIAGARGSVEALTDFLESGGTVILSPGDGGNASGFSALLQSLGAGSAPDVMDAREAEGYEAIIGEADLRHPVLAPFEGTSALLRPRFRRYARIEPAEGGTVVARFDTGDPFLIERSVGAGRLLIYASTFNTGWTDMPLDEMYVPFVYQLAEYGSRRTLDDLLYTVGDVVPFQGTPGARWEVRTPDGELYRVTIDESGRGYFRETATPGHYAAASGGAGRLFSVNIDPRESDLRPRDPEEVYAAVTAPGRSAPVSPEQAAAVVDDERRQKLWRILLLAVIALFAAETWFSHRNRKAAAPVPVGMKKAA